MSGRQSVAEQAWLVTCQEKVKDKGKKRENETLKRIKYWVSVLYREDPITPQIV